MYKESLATHRNTNASENKKIMNLLQNYKIIPKNVSKEQLEQTLLDLSENPTILDEPAEKTIDMPSKATTELVYLEITPEPLLEEFEHPESIHVDIPTQAIQFEQPAQTSERITQADTVEIPNNIGQSEQLTQPNSVVTEEDPLVDEFLNPETRPITQLANKEAITNLTPLSSKKLSKAINNLDDSLQRDSDKIFNDLHNYSKFLFKSIQSQEMNKHITNLAPNNINNQYCPNVASIVNFSDKLASCISESVLSTTKLNQAQKQLDSWMKLGDKAIQNKDFQLANTIFATINSGPMYRLLNDEQKTKQNENANKYLIMGTKNDSEVLKLMKSPGSIPYMGYYKSKFEFHKSSPQDIKTLKTEILNHQETVNYIPEKEKTGIINLLNQDTIGMGNFMERSKQLKPRAGLA